MLYLYFTFKRLVPVLLRYFEDIKTGHDLKVRNEGQEIASDAD
jgi:hypothetical protein